MFFSLFCLHYVFCCGHWRAQAQITGTDRQCSVSTPAEQEAWAVFIAAVRHDFIFYIFGTTPRPGPLDGLQVHCAYYM